MFNQCFSPAKLWIQGPVYIWAKADHGKGHGSLLLRVPSEITTKGRKLGPMISKLLHLW